MVHLETKSGDHLAVHVPLGLWIKVAAMFVGSLLVYLGGTESWSYFVHPAIETRMAVLETQQHDQACHFKELAEGQRHLDSKFDSLSETITSMLLKSQPTHSRAQAIESK